MTIITIPAIEEWAIQEEALRYGVYTHTFYTSEGDAFERSFIVLKDESGLIKRFTRLHLYAKVYHSKTAIPLTSDPKKKLYHICSMLNYVLVDHGNRYGIRHVFNITKPMLTDYFNAYALEKKADDSHKSAESIERCVCEITDFMAELSKSFRGYVKVTSNELYRQDAPVKTGKYGRKRYVPDFQIRGIFEPSRKFRDLPTKAVELLIPLAFRYAPDIAFAICIQAFAGLRAGEVMSIRREDSPLGAGITFTELSGTITEIKIDLSSNMVLRSDDMPAGHIKKYRMQKVYPPYRKAFCQAYEYHKRFLEGRPYEAAYGPMFINRSGKAMTYRSYHDKFDQLISYHLIPELLKASDPELRLYGQLLCENRLTPHALRHWFTVQLVLRGENIAGIQYWRGDKNPESAFVYLQNKGDLNKELRAAGDSMAQLLLKAGEELLD